ncbi:MAG TPA: mycothiol conjugate amidase Mca [Acidimicrobiia bacterium]
MLDAETNPDPRSIGPCVLSIHAHPDDEASKGASTMARYRTQGVRTVLITCTGGEAGEILNPAADSPEARADLGKVRMAELDEAVRIIGYDALYLLGYRDSGMPDTEWNADPRNFANADLDEAVGRIVRVLRAERPQVVVTYDNDSRGYSHPDHLRVHETSVLAFDRAGDPDWYPDAGDPWQPLKLYYSSGFSRRRIRTMHEWLIDHGEESPFHAWIDRMAQDGDDEDATTTRIDVSDFLEIGRAALLAHRTQVAPDSIFFSMPLDVARDLHPWDEYVLARSLVETGQVDDEFETDLFAGIPVHTGS